MCGSPSDALSFKSASEADPEGCGCTRAETTCAPNTFRSMENAKARINALSPTPCDRRVDKTAPPHDVEPRRQTRRDRFKKNQPRQAQPPDPARVTPRPRRAGCASSKRRPTRTIGTIPKRCEWNDTVNDPSAGSPTETLLRLLLPLNDKVWTTSRGISFGEPTSLPQSKGLTGSFNR